jgi:SAM-dependent methyltransferase
LLDHDLVTFVAQALPEPPARVLEVGAGDGELAAHLRSLGYEVAAIDPAGAADAGVDQVTLLDYDARAGGFDAVLAVLSLHHVNPLAESCRHLATLVRPGGVLVVDEFDIAAFDVAAARWWLDHHPSVDAHDRDPESMVGDMRAHLHPLSRVLDELARWFELTPPERGPYLYRWALGPELRAAEDDAIATDDLVATGARVIGRRR